MNQNTRDLAPKAKVLRCREHHALRRRQGVALSMGGGAFHGGGTFHRGWHIQGGGFDFGPYLLDGRGGGVASMEAGKA